MAVGRIDAGSARQVNDLHGLALAPGFIDVHTHDDRLLLLCGLVLIGLHLQRQRKKNSWRIGVSNAPFPSSWHPEHGRTGA